MSAAIKRVWRAIAMGGASTVVAETKPGRNDTRIPAYGYDEAKGHCIAYPFLDDDGKARMDFVCFSHDDARLVAAAPELLAVAELLALATDEGDDLASGTHYIDKTGRIRCKGSFLDTIERARAAIAKANGSAV